ncbi:AAA family ATPase [Limibacter armeniacum]|uniref:ATP-binding protein n=1 Tax=Limibacter armeniacum TaxID=466084 RepID=UPI002FE66A8C
MIKQIEAIAKSAHNSRLDMTAVLREKKVVRAVAESIQGDEIEAVFFSVLFTLNFQNDEIYLKDIAEYFDCETIRLAEYLNVIDRLVEKRLVRKFSSGSIMRRRTYNRKKERISSIGYFITKDVLDGVLQNNLMGFENSSEQLSLVSFLERVDDLMEEREDEEMTYFEMRKEVFDLIDQNTQLHICKSMKELKLGEIESLFLLHLAYETISGNPEVDVERACNRVFEDLNHRFMLRKLLLKGSANLCKMELIKLEEGMFRNDREVMLTEKGIKILFGDDADVIQVERTKIETKNLITIDQIKVQELFYNQEEQSQVRKLTSVLHERKLKKIQKKLDEYKMQQGFSVLMYGAPGTGKTATVYKLAKETGRSLYRVEASEVKSMWHGESEKNLKRIFDIYSEMVKQSDKAPILFLNEADAILSRRIDVHHAIDQTANALQNILLQEMEDLNGILIATTNLANNLDKAFERRFLFKLRFNAPTAEVRRKIWRSKIVSLSNKEAKLLADEFEFSGGQIDNIARKYLMSVILNNREPDLDELRSYCLNESIQDVKNSRLGF